MERDELVSVLRRLSKVGFGYDLTPEDKEALRQVANEIEDMGGYADFVRGKAREILGQSH